MKKKVGLIVNPVAGIGGRVALKGSDGNEVLLKAKEMNGKSESFPRTVEALKKIIEIKEEIELITYPFDMGEEEAKKAGFQPKVIGNVKRGFTTATDTIVAAKEMNRIGISLLLFTGGDGTARDIYEAIGNGLTVIGIPSGVKMHSAIFATSPANAGHLARGFLQNLLKYNIKEAEVMDIDEDAFRKNRLSAKLYGYLKIPYEKNLIQEGKSASSPSEEAEMESITKEIVNLMQEGYLYIMGPGTTIQYIMKSLSLDNTLLGVDAVYNYNLLGKDLNENEILSLMVGKKTKIIVTIIGGQGYIFGRGNLQISWRVIEKVGKEDILIVSTKNKLVNLKNGVLFVDTGCKKIDKQLSGYIQVITGINERFLAKVNF